MIEVEKKFILNKQDIDRIAQDAEFLGEHVLIDVYYDTEDFSLTSKDWWLRSRGGTFELKIPLHVGVERLIDQYKELKEDQKIRGVLDLPSKGNLTDTLEEFEYVPFCTCKTVRKKYKKKSFVIDFDIADFGDFQYTIAEIELMVNRKAEIERAAKAIIAFAKEQKLIIAPVRGKVIEYLRQTKPNHYRVLVERNVVKDF